MLPPRRIAGFFCRLLVIYGLLVIPWPGIKAAYAALYSGSGNLFFGSLVSGGSVRFHPMSPPKGKFDTHIHLVNLRSAAKETVITSSRIPGYLPTAFLVSLVLATPLPWRRRLWALLCGLLLVNAGVVCKLFVTVLHRFSSTGLSLLAPAPLWKKLLRLANDFAEGDVVMLLMLPVFIWILVSFRGDDIRMIVDRTRRSRRDVAST